MELDPKEPREPCGNEDCDLCYPLPRWQATRVVLLRHERFGEVKAPTPEAARAVVESFGWPSSYAQSVVEDHPAVIEPLDSESLAWHASNAAEWVATTRRQA